MKILPLFAFSATTFAIGAALAGCGDGKTQTTNVSNPPAVETKPAVEGSAVVTDPKSANAGATNTSGAPAASGQQAAAQSPAAASSALALADIKLLAYDSAGALVGATSAGTGFSNVNFPGRKEYTNEKVGAAQQFSIRSEAHVLLTDAGVKFVSGAISKAAAEAAPAVAYPASFNGTSKVVGLAKDLAILNSGNSIAIFAAGAAPVVSGLPAGFGAVIGAGKASGADAFWFMSATKLAYLGKGAGETAYTWVPPSNITVAVRAGETLQAVHVKISFTGSTPKPDANYFALTNKQLWTLNSSAAGDAQSGSASQAAVGSN
jgi:hypothetical protein